ncbi:glycosyltransferase family 2 protein [Sphingobium aromaticiconvertens]|uniref:glycosyltransferase family 2 protein n=1 Tax=Sphingobium aromaticiconvertens TaxID=365341 RepID=UPI00301B51EB
MSDSTNILIILVNWNGWRDSIACIRSCLMLDQPGIRIMLCDNESGDGSVEKILDWAEGRCPAPDAMSPIPLGMRRPDGVALLDRKQAEDGADGDGAQLLIVPTGGNLGFAGGNNIGLRWAMARGCDHAWLLNNDTVVRSDALSMLVRTMECDPSPGICGSVILDFEYPDRIQAIAGAMQRNTLQGRHIGTGLPLASATQTSPQSLLRKGEFLYPIGASILVSRPFLEQVGLMNEAYFLYYEESDWILRSQGLFRATIAPESLVYHHMGASTGYSQDGVSARALGYLYRSRLLAARLHAPNRLPMVVARMLWEAARGLLSGQRARTSAVLNALGGRVRPPI